MPLVAFPVKPLQAVILCGGRGSRLRPLTDNLPKPMAPVNGAPFLAYLLRQLEGQGIINFLLLTGYLADYIEEYFGDGSPWGWKINYSRGPAEWDTGRRLYEARNQIESQFLLLYSDNFVQFKLDRLQSIHEREATPISLLLSPKTKGNIKVSGNLITKYDNSRASEGLDYVEVGYMIVDRDAILRDMLEIPNFPNINFSALLEIYANTSKLSGLIVKDAYHSISDPSRLELTSTYLKPKKIILIDRDGTINKKAPPGEYINTWEQFEWLTDTRLAMRELARYGFEFIVITNQAGIARGITSEVNVADIHKRMTQSLAAEAIVVKEIYVSPHHWDEDSFDRKPEPGMFFQASKKHLIRLDHCMYVGDDERDCVAAANAGCGMVYISSDVSGPEILEIPTPFIRTKSLAGAVNTIVDQYSTWEQEMRSNA